MKIEWLIYALFCIGMAFLAFAAVAWLETLWVR